MSLEHTGYRIDLKELDTGDGEGTFTGYASTFGNKDLDGDVILRGAFADTLANDFKAGGAGIPLHWQHKDGSPNDVIGETLSAVEDEKGLLITGRLDIDVPEIKRAYDLLKRGLIHQMSIGYIAEQSAWVDGEKGWIDGYRELRKVKLFEISLVQIAANQEAEVIEVKAGRAISKANESKIRTAYDALGELLDSITETPDDRTEPDPPNDPDDDPDDANDDKPESGAKSFAPEWEREYKTISDFFSLANQ